jgi:hypothetical protein
MFIVLAASAAHAQRVTTPFGAGPLQLPGTIEAENFDNGGPGVAYVDDSPGNSGGAYRATDVDIEAASGGGYNLGWVNAGEWLAYTVNVATTGAYTVEFRVASLGPGGTFHLEMNGTDVTGAIRVPDTGDWQTWQTVTKTVSLTAGVQVARLVMDTTGLYAVGNFDWMRFTFGASTPFSGTPILLPGTIEAEDFDNGGPGVAYVDDSPGNSGGAYRATDVDIEAASGGGFDVGWVNAGEWLKYSVNVADASAYLVSFRVASLGPGGTFHLEMNGIDVTGAIHVPDTGGWQTWQNVTQIVRLSKGVQVARLVMDAPGMYAVGNFDSVTFTPKQPTQYGQAPELPGLVEAERFDLGGPGVAYVDDSPGNSGGAYRVDEDVDIESTTDVGGGYNVGWVSAGEWLSYTVIFPSTEGLYTIRVRVASPGAGGSFHIEDNGDDLTGPIAIPDTGGWQTWATVERAGISLPHKEIHFRRWRLVMDTVGASGAVGNFNWFSVAREIPVKETDLSSQEVLDGKSLGIPSQAYAINDIGTIVGTRTSMPEPNVRMPIPFRWSSSGLQDLGVPFLCSALESCPARAVNNYDEVAGYWWNGDTSMRGLLWRNTTTATEISRGFAYGINDATVVVGTNLVPMVSGSPLFFGYRWTPSPGDQGTLAYLDPDAPSYWAESSEARFIRNDGVVVGTRQGKAVIWQQDATVTELGSGVVNAMNDRRALAVGQSLGSPIVWRDGLQIWILRGSEGEACAVNEAGYVVGWVKVLNQRHAFVWQESLGLQDLGPGEAHGIDEAGNIVGWRTTALGSQATLWQVDLSVQDLFIGLEATAGRLLVGPDRAPLAWATTVLQDISTAHFAWAVGSMNSARSNLAEALKVVADPSNIRTVADPSNTRAAAVLSLGNTLAGRLPQ